MKRRSLLVIGTGLLWMALALIRYIGLHGYPAPSPDEGFWSIGAKNAVKFHEPLMDRRLHLFLSPTTFLLLTGYFYAVEPGLLAARVCSATVGLIAAGLMWGLGQRIMPGRPWLLVLLFGMNSMVALENRKMMIETQQILWLTATAFLWLRPSLGAAAGAAACFGVALLTKSNSIFLLPGLIWSAYGREPSPVDPVNGSPLHATARSRLALLGLIAGTVAILGYGGACAAFPAEFCAAFKFELDGQQWLSNDVVFRLGRFGVNPPQVKKALVTLVKGAPFWVSLAPLGLAWCVRDRWAARADRLFGAWLIVGLLFFFSQIYIAPRYLTTLAPAFAYLAARPLYDLLDAGSGARWARPAVVTLLVLFVGYHTGRIACGVYRSRDDDSYLRAIAWVSRNFHVDDRVIASPYIGISLPQRTYDPFRMTHAYGREDQPRSFEEIVADLDIRAVLVDDEPRVYMTAQDEAYLRESCSQVACFGQIEVYRVPPAGAGRSASEGAAAP
jgi:hypothetical protein